MASIARCEPGVVLSDVLVLMGVLPYALWYWSPMGAWLASHIQGFTDGMFVLMLFLMLFGVAAVTWLFSMTRALFAARKYGVRAWDRACVALIATIAFFGPMAQHGFSWHG